MHNLIIGCVADDFTGASDAASLISQNGLSTIMFNGIPEMSDMEYDFDVQAFVIALKSRTQETKSAVMDNLAAFRFLKANGARLLYFKYCSTFDSTPRGNIGPVIDAVLDEFHLNATVICPTMLLNKRMVMDGILLVDGVPLQETHMRNHPLTPMWSGVLSELLRPQSKYETVEIDKTVVDNQQLLNDFVSDKTASSAGRPIYFVPDYFKPRHGQNLAKQFIDWEFLTGGSGFLGDLANYYAKIHHITAGSQKDHTVEMAAKENGKLILAGSCSAATQKQVHSYLKTGKLSVLVSAKELRNGQQSIACFMDVMTANPHEDIMFYSAGSAGIREEDLFGNQADSQVIENTLADLAKAAVGCGKKRIIVAGGEISGAVIKNLGYKSFIIGESVAPGVPIMNPVENKHLTLVLKSGNFGDENFFSTVPV